MLSGLKFIADKDLYHSEKPYILIGFPDISPDAISNCEYDCELPVDLTDIRGKDVKFTLATSGFEYLDHESKVCLDGSNYTGAAFSQEIVDAYLAETLELVQSRCSSSRIVLFDWRVRNSNIQRKDVPTNNPAGSRNDVQAPGTVVHCDYSSNGGFDILESRLTEQDMSRVHDGSLDVQFMNLWRPMNTVKCAPLAFCEAQSLRNDDLIEVDKVCPERVEMGYFLKHRTYHKWYWKSLQTPKEPVLFVSWDPKDTYDGKTTGYHCPPHGACMEIKDAGGEMGRESIEVRCIIMTEK